MTDLFAEALAHELVYEGGKVDLKSDPGGRTAFGVTQRVYNGWRAKSNLPTRDVFDIAQSEVEAIYRFQYWQTIHGDALPRGTGFVVMDGAVNSGPKQSVKWLQRALGFTGPDVDGVIGSVTIDAVNAYGDQDELIAKIIDQREAFLRALKTFDTFGRGWINRINAVKETGQAWAVGSVGPEPVHIPGANAKAKVEDAKMAPGKGLADAATGSGIGAGTLAGTLNQLQEKLTPYSIAGNWIEKLVLGLFIASAVLTIGGLAWRWYSTSRKSVLADALNLQPVSK